MELSTETAQLAVLKGERQRVTPGAGVVRYKSPWGTGTLYVFAESRGPDPAFAGHLIVEAIGREFKASNRSLTASLAVAIRAAHHELAAENRQSMPDQRATASVTCAAVRGGEIYFAQAGPAVAYCLFDGRIQRLPAASSRTLPSWSTPLGGSQAVQVTLARHHLHPGDVVLLTSSLLAAGPVESELPDLLAQGVRKIVPRLERIFGDEPAFSALAIGFDDAAKRSDASLPANAGQPAPRNGISPGSTTPPALDAVGAAPSKVELPRIGGRKATGALLALFGRGNNGKAPVRRSARSDHPSVRRTRGSVAKLPHEQLAPVKIAEAGAESRPVKAGGKVGGAATAGKKPGPTNPSKSKRSRARSLRLPLFLMMLVLAGLIACSLATLYNRFSDKQDEGRFERALSSAAVTRERALNAGDLAISRSLFNDADQLVNQALSLKRSDSKARALKQRILADLAKLNAVVRLPEAKVLTDLAKVEGGAKNLTNLIVEGEDIFILDRGTSRVYQLGVDLASGALKVGRNTLVAKKGDKVGETRLSDLVSILWMGQGPGRQSSNLLIFDSARNLFEHTPGKGMAQLKVRGAGAWQNPALALGYSSNLYVLDPSASQVWRYFPTFSGYDSEMRGLLENADIRDAVDFAIDGQIYVLTRAGNVSKFVGGRPESFNLDQLDKGLANPTAIHTSPRTNSVYVLDAGNNRVLVFSKEGKFLRQLLGEALEESPRSIYVDEERRKLYVLSNNKLYLSDLPK